MGGISVDDGELYSTTDFSYSDDLIVRTYVVKPTNEISINEYFQIDQGRLRVNHSQGQYSYSIYSDFEDPCGYTKLQSYDDNDQLIFSSNIDYLDDNCSYFQDDSNGFSGRVINDELETPNRFSTRSLFFRKIKVGYMVSTEFFNSDGDLNGILSRDIEYNEFNYPVSSRVIDGLQSETSYTYEYY